MNYLARVRDIQLNFVMGYQDRETCISKFETLLHEYGLLPAEEVLDRTITNENFIALLKLAREHKDPKSSRDPEVSKECPACSTGECLEHNKLEKRDSTLDINPGLPFGALAGQPLYRIADSVKQRCPVCQKPSAGLYSRLQGADQQTIPVDPPRCQECMMKWVEKYFGTGPHSKLAEPKPSFSLDSTTAQPMSVTEFDFFKQYESEMEDFKP